MDKNIIWLASYPKSGNTWFRSFVSALLNKGQISINNLYADGIFSGKNIIETVLDLESEWLADKEVFDYQITAWNFFAQTAKKKLLIKIHDAIRFENDRINIPVESTNSAIYIVRHPFDVVLSFANHQGISIDESIDFLNNKDMNFVERNSSPNIQFRQKLFSWAGHVESWRKIDNFPVLFIRYEDMIENPLKCFSDAVEFLGWNYNTEEIQLAIEACSFEKLKQQEVERGFKEKNVRSKSFFHIGRSGYGKLILTDEQRNAIVQSNYETMKIFNYL